VQNEKNQQQTKEKAAFYDHQIIKERLYRFLTVFFKS